MKTLLENQLTKVLFLSVMFLMVISMNTFETNVYICKGKYSKKYHYKKTCRGLSNCKATISKVTINDAKELGRTLCGWED
ncbi:hypothetical protein [Hanstruepera ponticola]|uniref:hypothetical protein n=1 Tax=Hanstruepera ponticola TaxID=2042995 RepID=UPI001F1F84FA|nr:hypothetical protein [Hanstruepera ponticola]